MPRHLHAIWLFWTTSFAAEMEYRLNFVVACINSTMTLAGSIFTLLVLYGTGYAMGGWTWPEALSVMAFYTILDGLQQTLLAPNRTRITELVREGTLDFVLLKPIDAQFWLSTRQVSIWGLPNVVLGLIMLVYAGVNMDPPLAWWQYGLALPPLALGVAILYSLGYLLSTLTIWYVKLSNITQVMASLLEAGRYPIPAYPLAWRVMFTFVIPVAFMTTVPARVVTGHGQVWAWLAGSAIAAAVLLLASRAFWLWALRSYTSASS